MNLYLNKLSPITGQYNSYIDRQGSRMAITDFKCHDYGAFSGPTYIIIRPDKEASEVEVCPNKSIMFIRRHKF
jgi:hypothetical protein